MDTQGVDLQARNRRLADKWEQQDRFDCAEEHRRYMVETAQSNEEKIEALKCLIVNLNAQGKVPEALGWENEVHKLFDGGSEAMAKSYVVIEIEWARSATLRDDANAGIRHYLAAHNVCVQFPVGLSDLERYCLSQLAELLSKEGRIFQAETYLREMVARTERVANCFPSYLDWLKMLAVCLLSQAKYWQAEGQRAKYLAAYEAAFEVAAKEARERDNAHKKCSGLQGQSAQAARELARALNVLANIHLGLGRSEAARLAFEQAAKLELHLLDLLQGQHPHFADSLRKYVQLSE